jgi:branched-chain amino acid transport system permease protein
VSQIVSSVALDLPAHPPRQRRLLGPALLFVALALVPLAARLGTESYVLSLMTRVVALALAALSLDLLVGIGGLVSFGHAAFVGIGAYAVAILASEGITDGFVQIAVALGCAAAFALVTGIIALRTQGVFFIMITLAFGQMLYFLFTALAGYGGDDGMALAQRSRILGRDLLAGDTALYLVSLGMLLAVYLLLRAVIASRFGRVLAGARENEIRMESIGFEPFRYRLVAYVLSGMIAAIAGCLLANQTAFISPASMAWQRSGDLIFMVVLGGLGSLHGAIIGAVVYVLSEEILAGFTEHWRILFGPLLILVVLFARGGLTGLLAPRGARP